MRAGPLALAILLSTTVAATAFVFADNGITVQPEEYYAKTCSGQAVGVVAGFGTTYVCENGFWVRADVVHCSPDPPTGACAGRPLCQSSSDGEIYYCPNGQWITIAAQILGCDNCTEGPAVSLNNSLVRFDGTTGQILKDSSAVLLDTGALYLSQPLGVQSGGTGGGDATTARAGIGAAADSLVVHKSGDETIMGVKTFDGTAVFGSVLAYRYGGIRRSDLFPSVASALADLPVTGGVLELGPDENDSAPFIDINPASEFTGRRDTLAVDYRKGGMRFLSSMPEYPSGAAGPLEDRVPFVFQVRLDDPTRSSDLDFGAIGEWNCASQPGLALNCPSGNSSWGIPGGSRQFWYSGQCNASDSPMTEVGTTGLCSGPHIFEIRYPEQPGVLESKPIFAVGNGGAALYAPENPSLRWRTYLAMFRGNDGGGESIKANSPLFVFDKAGASLDGGTFLGNTLAFPYYSQHTYPPFNVWIQHDISLSLPALVVEGTTDQTELGQISPLTRFLDRSGKGTFVHPGLAREAFGFYSHSRLYLGSYRDDVAALDRGQYIEWEGYSVDSNTTKLRAAEPTGENNLTLPDRTGTLVVAPPAGSAMGPVLWGSTGATGTQLCDASGLICAQTVAYEGGGVLTVRSRNCNFAHTSLFIAMCETP